MEQHLEAFYCFSQALNLNIKNRDGLFWMVQLGIKLKRYSLACRLVKRYLDEVESNPELLYCYAGLLFHLNEFSEARRVSEEILRRDPKFLRAQELLDRL